MVQKSFSELLVELNSSYEGLMAAKVALESEVIALRGVLKEQASFNLLVPPDGHVPVVSEMPAEGAVAQLRHMAEKRGANMMADCAYRQVNPIALVEDPCLAELAFDIAKDIASTSADAEAVEPDVKHVRMSLCSDGGIVPAEFEGSHHSVNQPRVNALPSRPPGDSFHLGKEKYWTEKGTANGFIAHQDMYERLEAAIARVERLVDIQNRGKSHRGASRYPLPSMRERKRGNQTFSVPNFIDDAARRKMAKSLTDSESSRESEWRSVRNSNAETGNFSERIHRATVALEFGRQETSSFGWKWEGDKARRNSSVIEVLRKTRGVVMNNPKLSQQPFDIFSGVVIITYVLFLGVETEIRTREMADFDTSFFVLHMIYNTYFLIELIVRMWIFRWKFFIGKECRLNILDFLLVVSSVIDIVMQQDGGSSPSARMLRSIRVIRLIRTLRIVRAMRDIREFQKMVFAITSSLKTLAYSIVILFFILYFFAVVFAYGAMEAKQFFPSTPRSDLQAPTTEELKGIKIREDLEQYWGTFFVSIYSCFLSVSTGQSWYYVVQPLSEYSVVFTLCFLGFILLTIFGVLNAITSIFVESSLMSAQHYKDLIILDKAHEKELALNHIRAVFRQIDEDGSGEISCEELEYFLSHEALRKYMEALNITTEDTDMLFRLLDLDGSGIIDFEEFCTGCMRLKGEARAFDVHVMLLQIRHFMDKWSNFTRYVAEQLGTMDQSQYVATASMQSNVKSDLPGSPRGDGTGSNTIDRLNVLKLQKKGSMESLPEYVSPYRSIQTMEFTDQFAPAPSENVL